MQLSRSMPDACSMLDIGFHELAPDASKYWRVAATLQVRKKAVMALHRFEQLDPAHEGPLSGADIDAHLRRMLCDKVGTCIVACPA